MCRCPGSSGVGPAPTTAGEIIYPINNPGPGCVTVTQALMPPESNLPHRLPRRTPDRRSPPPVASVAQVVRANSITPTTAIDRTGRAVPSSPYSPAKQTRTRQGLAKKAEQLAVRELFERERGRRNARPIQSVPSHATRRRRHRVTVAGAVRRRKTGETCRPPSPASQPDPGPAD